MKRMAKVMAPAFTLLLAMSSMTFAMWSGTISQSDFQNHVKAGKFAIFVKDGSTIKMYEPSSPSSAVSEFKSALPSGRNTVYTGNIAVRDYLEEYGYYDYYHQGVDIGGDARAYEFTAWEKMYAGVSLERASSARAEEVGRAINANQERSAGAHAIAIFA